MKLGPTLPITNRSEARRIAQEIVRQKFSMGTVVRELYGIESDGNYGSPGDGTLGSQLLKEPAVMMELNSILSRTGNDAEKFLKKMWEWLDDETEGKEQNERRQTAARILAKGYIREKGPVGDAPTKPMVISGLEEGIGNLTGETPVKPETDPKKVM